MAEVLQWDVDFNKDLQPGDTFAALYEEVRLDQRYHSIGNVRAVVLENGGRRLEAYRFGDGYYDASGRPLAKLFLKSPLPYTRITSKFTPPPLPSRAQVVSPALRRRLRSAGGNAGARHRRRGGAARRLGRRRRSHREAAPSRRVHDRLPASLQVRPGHPARRACRAGRRHRLRRRERPRHRSAPRLSSAASRQVDRSHLAQGAAVRADHRGADGELRRAARRAARRARRGRVRRARHRDRLDAAAAPAGGDRRRS